MFVGHQKQTRVVCPDGWGHSAVVKFVPYILKEHFGETEWYDENHGFPVE